MEIEINHQTDDWFFFTSYRRQDPDFTRDRYGNSRDQLLEDLQIKVHFKVYINVLPTCQLNVYNFYSLSCCLTEVLTASILSGSERRAAPIPPCKSSEVSQRSTSDQPEISQRSEQLIGYWQETHLSGVFFWTSHIYINSSHIVLPGW